MTRLSYREWEQDWVSEQNEDKFNQEGVRMEFLVLASRSRREYDRERKIIQAVIEASERVGVERVVFKRGDVYSTGVYLNSDEEKIIVYNDYERKWNRKRICQQILLSIGLESRHENERGICLTA